MVAMLRILDFIFKLTLLAPISHAQSTMFGELINVLSAICNSINLFLRVTSHPSTLRSHVAKAVWGKHPRFTNEFKNCANILALRRSQRHNAIKRKIRDGCTALPTRPTQAHSGTLPRGRYRTNIIRCWLFARVSAEPAKATRIACR